MTTFIQLWDQFIIIKNFKQYPMISSLLTGYEGENLIGYSYIDHEQGITLDVLNLFTENDGEYIIGKNLVEDKIRAFLRFDHFYETDFRIAGDEIVSEFNVKIPDYLKIYERKDLEYFRLDQAYDKFRTQGFPDDIQILLINNKNSPELIWARVEDYDRESKIGSSKLLVQPHQNFNLNKDDDLVFKLMEINNQHYPVGIIDNKPEKKWWKFW